MIDLEIFTGLPLRQKIKTLYEHGSFVVAIRYYGYKINLYLIGKYYVEVFYNHKLDCIEKVELMDPQHSRLKFYTDQINLPKNML